MAEIRNKDETSKPSNHSGREQKRNYKQHIKTLNTTAYSSHCLFKTTKMSPSSIFGIY